MDRCRWILRAALFALLVACAPVDQESVRTVAAVEIQLRTEADRSDLVSMLRRHAGASGLHVDDVSERWQAFEREANMIAPEDRGTFYVGVWRGEDDDEAEVLADDQFHPGRAWVTFPRGQQPDRSTRVREPLLAEIRQRWPGARALPILPTGGLPLVDDLVATESGYRIVRSAAQRYRLPLSSPLLGPR
jgi:hypothetical protein